MDFDFVKYQHVENDLNSIECEGLLDGKVIIQPKLDGTNCQIWLQNGVIKVSSRNRVLSLHSDNARAYTILHKCPLITKYLQDNPTHKLCGEWLIPHHVQYVSEAYNKLYVFDVIDLEKESRGEEKKYIFYPDIMNKLTEYGINAVPVAKINSSLSIFQIDIDLFNDYLLIPNSIPEGIVVKNYDYTNKFGRQTWCKVLHPKFNSKIKIKKDKEEIDHTQDFINLYLTEHEIIKTYHKIYIDDTVKNKTGEFIQTLYYDLVKENIADYVYKKNCNIDFMCIKTAVQRKVIPYLKEKGKL